MEPCKRCGTTTPEAFETPTAAWCSPCWSTILADESRRSWNNLAAGRPNPGTSSDPLRPRNWR